MWLGRDCEDPRDRITPSLAEATRTGNDVVRLAELQNNGCISEKQADRHDYML